MRSRSLIRAFAENVLSATVANLTERGERRLHDVLAGVDLRVPGHAVSDENETRAPCQRPALTRIPSEPHVERYRARVLGQFDDHASRKAERIGRKGRAGARCSVGGGPHDDIMVSGVERDGG